MSLPFALLPDQRRVACANPAEVPALYRQIGPYFRHGITLRAGDTVFDVGANIGLFSLAASEWGKKPLRGFAFEPAPSLFEALQVNLAAQAPGIQAVACAVSNQPGTLELHYFARLTALSTAFPAALQAAATRGAVADQLHRLPREWRWLARLPRPLRLMLVALGMRVFLRPVRVSCPACTLSSVIDEHAVAQVDLLKIDVERAELDVLRGLRDEHWPRIRQVVMEVHDEAGRLAVACDLLRRHGFAEPVLQQSPDMQPFGVWQLWARRPDAP